MHFPQAWRLRDAKSRCKALTAQAPSFQTTTWTLHPLASPLAQALSTPTCVHSWGWRPLDFTAPTATFSKTFALRMEQRHLVTYSHHGTLNVFSSRSCWLSPLLPSPCSFTFPGSSPSLATKLSLWQSNVTFRQKHVRSYHPLKASHLLVFIVDEIETQEV